MSAQQNREKLKEYIDSGKADLDEKRKKLEELYAEREKRKAEQRPATEGEAPRENATSSGEGDAAAKGLSVAARSFIPKTFTVETPPAAQPIPSALANTQFGYEDEDEDEGFEDDDEEEAWASMLSGFGLSRAAIEQQLCDNIDDDYDAQLEEFERENAQESSEGGPTHRSHIDIEDEISRFLLDAGVATAAAPAAAPAAPKPQEEEKAPKVPVSSGAQPPAKEEAPKPRERTEFELLRLAKLGDLEEFRNAEAEGQIDIVKLLDNRQRNCLHCAADGGNAKLVTYLLDSTHKFDPNLKDEFGMTAAEIACLGHRDECLNLLCKSEMEAAKFSASALLAKHAPAPPRVTFSKPTPKQLPAVREHAFWGIVLADAPVLGPGLSVHGQGCHAEGCVESDRFNQSQLYDLLMTAYTSESTGLSFDSWLAPFVKADLRRIARAYACVYASCTSPAGDSVMVGCLLSVACGDLHIRSGKTVLCCSGQLLGSWCVRPKFRGAHRIAPAMMCATQKCFQGRAGVFFSREPLPIAPYATIRYFRRCLNPLIVVDSHRWDIISDVLPSYAKFDSSLCCDEVLKGCVRHDGNPPALAAQHWQQLTNEDPAKVAQVVKFLNAQVSSGSYECYATVTPDEFARLYLSSPHVLVYILINAATNAVSDLVIFRRRFARKRRGEEEDHSATTSSGEEITALFVVLALMSSFKDEQRLLAIAHLAFLSAQVVYVTDTCGFSSKDMRMAFFEEVANSAQLMYVTQGSAASIAIGGNAAKVAFPIAPL